jgi:FkbM family methyltransferase
MSKLISRVQHKIKQLLIQSDTTSEISEQTIVQKEQSQQFELWFANRGDKTHRLNYDLIDSSIVFDLGGYEGQWSSDIFSKYGCNLFVFEPCKDFAKDIEWRFKKNNKIRVFPFGLSDKNKEENLSISGDSSSLYIKEGKFTKIELLKASEFIENNQIGKIDLMKINIEGSEYDLLEHLIDSNKITIIDNIQVQFHIFLPDSEIRMLNIQKSLALTHTLTYQYKYVWENWQRKAK